MTREMVLAGISVELKRALAQLDQSGLNQAANSVRNAILIVEAEMRIAAQQMPRTQPGVAVRSGQSAPC